MDLILLILISPLPSLIWLYFLLRAEKEKEPKRKIFEVFWWGAGFAFVLVLIVIIFSKILISLYPLEVFFKFWPQASDFFLPFIEEFFKFLPFYFFVRKSKFFNRPEDGIVYMVTSALGFAAVENFFFLFSPSPFSLLLLSFVLRFFTATYLHSLCGAVFGYYLASFYFSKRNLWKIFFGFLLAGFFHFYYNFLISLEKVATAIIYLFSLSVLIYIAFKKLWQVS